MSNVIVPVSMPGELFDRLEKLRVKSNNVRTGLIFKRSPFFVNIIEKGLIAMGETNGHK